MAVALSTAEKAGVPSSSATFQPMGVATDRYRGSCSARRRECLAGRAAALPPAHRLASGCRSAAVKRAPREVLGLSGSPKAHLADPVLYRFSGHVVPLAEGGPRARHVTGYWSPRRPGAALPVDLRSVSRDGSTVVSIGFGSMASKDGKSLTQLVVEAIQMPGVRAVLLWDRLDSASLVRGRRLCRRRAAHDILFR